MLYNLHTHTERCHHATGTDKEYVEAAIRAGFDVLGFADHCPQFFPNTDYYSSFRMRPEDFEGYVQSVRALQKEYAADIRILLGMETEYYPKTFAALTEFVRPYQIDYMIMGQHFIGNEFDANSYYSSVESSEQGRLETYVSQVIEGLETGAFTYLAHPDIMNYPTDDAFYRAQMTRLCRRAKELGVPLEYNILGHVNRKCYPTEKFWRIAAETGNNVVLGVDAHAPEALLNRKAYEECADALAKLGMTPMAWEALSSKLKEIG